MIFFGGSNIKFFILYFLVFIILGFIIFQWYQADPFSSVRVSNKQITTEVNNKIEDTFIDIKNSIEQDKETVTDLDEELAREEKQAQLIKTAQEYVQNLASSTEKVTSTDKI